jgi:thymidine phosphorylase
MAGATRCTFDAVAKHAGECVNIDNRCIARVAKLAGAPQVPAAGVELFVRLGQWCEKGVPLYTVHAQAPGELEYAMAYAVRHAHIVRLENR